MGLVSGEGTEAKCWLVASQSWAVGLGSVVGSGAELVATDDTSDADAGAGESGGDGNGDGNAGGINVAPGLRDQTLAELGMAPSALLTLVDLNK